MHADAAEKSQKAVDGNQVNAEETENGTETEVKAATADVKANAKRAELIDVDIETEITTTALLRDRS